MLEGKRLLITGVATTGSIAHATALRCLDQGAQVVLTAFPREFDDVVGLAHELDPSIAVLPLDLTDAAQVDDLARTLAAGAIPGFDLLEDAWATTSPLPWDVHDPAPVADVAAFLLSDGARAITAEVLHVDGGFHAMATALRP